MPRPVLRSCAVILALFWLRGSAMAAGEQTLELPPRDPKALTGSQVAERVVSLGLTAREQKITAEILSGNVPQFLRRLCPVEVAETIDGERQSCVFYVTPDYLAVGATEDYLLMPMSPNAVQRIADGIGCILPTRKMVDEIYAAAEVKLTPSPIPASPAMTTIAVFENHNALIRGQRGALLKEHPLGSLTAGHKKDVVITPRLGEAPGKVAIYGWHQSRGLPIQPLYLGHTALWVDYSQCARLVSRSVLLNGKPTRIEAVLRDPKVSVLLSDEGPIVNARYPANTVNTAPPRSQFAEETSAFTLDPDVHVLINRPVKDACLGRTNTLVIFYALPNGNSIEQTVGRAATPGDDWHYNIQHIGAQTRFLRGVVTNSVIVVVYLGTEQKSWPAWRKEYGDSGIPALIDKVLQAVGGQAPRIVLTGHSGGGSFTFGYLNTVERIPRNIARIAFLDSDYAYDSKLHQEKLATWLKDDPSHTLCVLAYDDAAARLEGKPIVSARGGTWGKSHELQGDLAQQFRFTSQTNAGLEKYTALDGRIQFLLKENPEHKILHTVQVERNGFIHAMLTATEFENAGYEYFGARAYTNLIQAP